MGGNGKGNMARLRIIKILNGHRGSGVSSSADELLKSDPINGSIGIPSHFQATLDQLEYLYEGLQIHYGVERLGKKKKWKLK